MSFDQTALPAAGPVPAEASGQTAAPADTSAEQDVSQEQQEQTKPEKTAEQREIARLQRRIGNLTRAKYELLAQVGQGRDVSVTQGTPQGQTAPTQADDEPVSLSRAELQKLIDEQARKLAPTISEANAEIERRSKTVETLAKSWGQEKFDTFANELDEVFGGLADAKGRPKPATDAIFESDSPRELIEYLTDPENAAEAEALARMSPVQAGRAVARLETRLSAKKADEAPQPSKAPRPIEPEARGRGNSNSAPNPTDTKAWIRWANEQERKTR